MSAVVPATTNADIEGIRSARTSRSPPLLSSDQRDAADSAEPTDSTDPTEKADRVDPTLPSDKADPTDPILSTDPADPIDRIDPRLAIDRNESWDRSDMSPTVIIVARRLKRGLPALTREERGGYDGARRPRPWSPARASPTWRAAAPRPLAIAGAADVPVLDSTSMGCAILASKGARS